MTGLRTVKHWPDRGGGCDLVNIPQRLEQNKSLRGSSYGAVASAEAYANRLSWEHIALRGAWGSSSPRVVNEVCGPGPRASAFALGLQWLQLGVRLSYHANQSFD